MNSEKLYEIASLERVVFGVIGESETLRIESNRRKKELLDAFVAQHNCKPDEVVLVELPMGTNSLRGYQHGYYYIRTKAHYLKIIARLDVIKEMVTEEVVKDEIDSIIHELNEVL